MWLNKDFYGAARPAFVASWGQNSGPLAIGRPKLAQPAVNGADLGRLNHRLLQTAAGGDVQIEVELVEPPVQNCGSCQGYW